MSLNSCQGFMSLFLRSHESILTATKQISVANCLSFCLLLHILAKEECCKKDATSNHTINSQYIVKKA